MVLNKVLSNSRNPFGFSNYKHYYGFGILSTQKIPVKSQTRSVTLNGQTYFDEKSTVLLSIQFNTDSSVVFYKINYYTYLDFLSHFGGFLFFIYAFFNYFGTKINQTYLTAKYIEELYFYKPSTHENI